MVTLMTPYSFQQQQLISAKKSILHYVMFLLQCTHLCNDQNIRKTLTVLNFVSSEDDRDCVATHDGLHMTR